MKQPEDTPELDTKMIRAIQHLLGTNDVETVRKFYLEVKQKQKEEKENK